MRRVGEPQSNRSKRFRLRKLVVLPQRTSPCGRHGPGQAAIDMAFNMERAGGLHTGGAQGQMEGTPKSLSSEVIVLFITRKRTVEKSTCSNNNEQFSFSQKSKICDVTLF